MFKGLVWSCWNQDDTSHGQNIVHLDSLDVNRLTDVVQVTVDIAKVILGPMPPVPATSFPNTRVGAPNSKSERPRLWIPRAS